MSARRASGQADVRAIHLRRLPACREVISKFTTKAASSIANIASLSSSAALSGWRRLVGSAEHVFRIRRYSSGDFSHHAGTATAVERHPQVISLGGSSRHRRRERRRKRPRRATAKIVVSPLVVAWERSSSSSRPATPGSLPGARRALQLSGCRSAGKIYRRDQPFRIAPSLFQMHGRRRVRSYPGTGLRLHDRGRRPRSSNDKCLAFWS